MEDRPTWIDSALSSARFAPYLAAADSDVDRALRLYWSNVEVSSAFYTALHVVEVAFRNALHTCLGTAFEQAEWWTSAPLTSNGRLLVTKAEQQAARRRKTGHSDVVTELSFGFWVSLLSRKYDRTLWVPHLNRALPHYRGRRDDLHRRLETVLGLRNRIMHHEPIHHRHLQADHATIYQLLGYLSPDLVACVAPLDRVPAALAVRP